MKRFLMITAMLLAATASQAARHIYTTKLVNEPGLAYNNTYVLDTTNLSLETLSAQAVYSTTTFTSSTFTDGAASTGSITVVSTQPLVGVAGTDTLTVKSNVLPSNAQFTINGYQFNQGGDWTTQDTSSNTAISMKNGINTYSTYLGVTASTPTTTTVKVTCNTIGVACNSNTMTVNTSSLTVSATFSGGVEHAKLCINGTCLTEGTDWTVVSTTTGTANAISDAIVANVTLAAIVTSTWTASSVVSSTSTGVGLATNYSLFCRPQASLSCFSVAYKGGKDSAIVTASGSLNIPSHGFTKALPLLYTKTAGTNPKDLVANTTYYVVPVDTNNFKLATTSAKAVAGTNDVRLSTQTATGGGSFAVAPLAYSGIASWKWQVSNDNVNWNDMTTNPNNVTVSSTTFSSPFTATSASYDLGPASYQYYRVNAIGPTQGGLNLVITATGKQSNPYRP